MIRAFFFFLLFGLTLFSYSQKPSNSSFQKQSIKGLVIDKETKQPLEYATISLTNLRRPEIIQGGITNSQGNFNIEVFPGKYNLEIEYISFRKYIQKGLNIRGPLDLGKIELEIEVNTLNEVEVMGIKHKVT